MWGWAQAQREKDTARKRAGGCGMTDYGVTVVWFCVWFVLGAGLGLRVTVTSRQQLS